MLEVRSLSHAYGGHEALREVTIQVRAGEAVAILGANGAGKTTLLNAIAGLLRIKSGSILFEERELAGMAPNCIVELGVAIVSENRHLFGPMSVIDNLMLGAYPRRAQGGAGETLHLVFDLFPRLAERQANSPQHEWRRTADGGDRPRVDLATETFAARRALSGTLPSSRVRAVCGALLYRAQRPGEYPDCRTECWSRTGAGNPGLSTLFGSCRRRRRLSEVRE
jgi:ABC-type sugar transport system ATPase subunit